MPESSQTNMNAFGALVDVLRTLRGPDGCPWDREQTPETLKSYLIEEGYETVEAINRGVATEVEEELGDTLLIVLLIVLSYEEDKRLSLTNVLETLTTKLIRRHPHVFGESAARTSGEVVKQWEEIKQEEKPERKKGLLDDISHHYPPLERARRMQKRAKRVGFDWPETRYVYDKVEEELRELKAIGGGSSDGEQGAREEEIGDLLFTVVNLARHLGVDPSVALNGANEKFYRRFKSMESSVDGSTLDGLGAEELEKLWEAAKAVK
ncbi:MAG: nucleoside triphosphate pyrophosphohydrolase [Spirochaetaceae bacterium]